jgi:hypothetical protein
MKRTTIMLPEEIDRRLRLEARRRGVSIAEVAREAIEDHLPPTAVRRPGFFGIGEGDPSDGSERVDELVGDAVAARHGLRHSSGRRS